MEITIRASLLLLISGSFLSSSSRTLPAQNTAPPSEMEMGHAAPANPPGPLTISYAGKSETWTAATLAALTHTTIALYRKML